MTSAAPKMVRRPARIVAFRAIMAVSGCGRQIIGESMTERPRAQQAWSRACAQALLPAGKPGSSCGANRAVTTPVYDRRAFHSDPRSAQMSLSRINRRDALLAALTLGAGAVMSRAAVAAGSGGTITKAIPSSGQKIPVIGVGTNKYDVTDADELTALRAVLEQLPMQGGAIVDTAPLYGHAEQVIGDLVAGLHNRERLFLATKVMTPDAKAGEASMEESLRRLKTQRIDLMQVHNLVGVEAMIPVLQEWKKAGRIGYYGITTSSPGEHGRMMDYMRRLPMDFIQIDYSLANRGADQEVLPLAVQKGIAVIADSPF